MAHHGEKPTSYQRARRFTGKTLTLFLVAHLIVGVVMASGLIRAIDHIVRNFIVPSEVTNEK